MVIRNLEIRDAEFMLEWMHDSDVIAYMQANFADRTLDDCKRFIIASCQDNCNKHFAIVDLHNDYQGTVSLKNIHDGSAEFAIVVSKKAMGAGYAARAMAEIIQYAFEVLDLKYIYWCVAKENYRAIRFYDKNGYSRIDSRKIENIVGYNKSQIDSFQWYKISNPRI